MNVSACQTAIRNSDSFLGIRWKTKNLRIYHFSNLNLLQRWNCEASSTWKDDEILNFRNDIHFSEYAQEYFAIFGSGKLFVCFLNLMPNCFQDHKCRIIICILRHNNHIGIENCYIFQEPSSGIYCIWNVHV